MQGQRGKSPMRSWGRAYRGSLRTSESPQRVGPDVIVVAGDDDNSVVYRIFQDQPVPRDSTEIAEEARIIIKSGSFAVFVQIPCPIPKLLHFGLFGGGLRSSWWRTASILRTIRFGSFT